MKLSDQITRRHLFVAFGSSAQTGSLSSVDLAAVRDGSSVTLTASDGSIAPIPGADAATAGVLTGADKAKLDGLPPTTSQAFSAFADIAATSVAAGITHLITAGHAAAGDGGGALYRRVAAEPAHALKAQSADGAWWEIVAEHGAINIKQCGARGDGVTNDTTAFQWAAAWLEAQSGGTLILPRGTYIVGRQAAVLDGSTSYTNEDIFEVFNCTRPVRVIGNGAIVKIADGLRYGAFDPNTGEPHDTPSLPFTDPAYETKVGFVLRLEDNAVVELAGIEIDGNNTNLLLGGRWGDSGRQTHGDNIVLKRNLSVTVRDIYTHHAPRDNLYLSYSSMTVPGERAPVTLMNIVSEYAGRLGLTWGGGRGLVAINCKANHTGRAVNDGAGLDSGQPLSSGPAAGFDIEAEFGSIREGHFLGCEFINNAGAGMIAFAGDTSDVLFDDCTFWGTTNYSISVDKPHFRFRACRIYGAIQLLYDATRFNRGWTPLDGIQFYDCEFEDRQWTDSNVFYDSTSGLLPFLNGKGWLIERGQITINNGYLGHLSNGVMRDVYIAVKTEDLANQSTLANFHDTLLDHCFFDDLTAHGLADGYGLAPDAETIFRDSYVKSPNSTLWWIAATGPNKHAGTSGRGSNNLQDQADLAMQELRLHAGRNRTAKTLVRVSADSAAPTSGTWSQGDIVFNTGAAASGKVGWVCVSGGSPGTWKAFGAIDA